MYKIKPNEVVRQCFDFPDYWVTNSGVVLSGHGWMHKDKSIRRRISSYHTKNGYEVVNIRHKTGKRKHAFVHRLVAFEFISNPNNLPEIHHKDNNPRNNCVENLEWVTHAQNQRNMVVSGRTRSRLTWDDIGEIRRLYLNGWKIKDIARKYKYNRNSIGLIVNNKTFKDEDYTIKPRKRQRISRDTRDQIRGLKGEIKASSLSQIHGISEVYIYKIWNGER